jgi:hypothetical protein
VRLITAAAAAPSVCRCRFQSSAAADLTSLADYVSRKKEGQKHIYYLAGERGVGGLGMSQGRRATWCGSLRDWHRFLVPILGVPGNGHVPQVSPIGPPAFLAPGLLAWQLKLTPALFWACWQM